MFPLQLRCNSGSCRITKTKLNYYIISNKTQHWLISNLQKHLPRSSSPIIPQLLRPHPICWNKWTKKKKKLKLSHQSFAHQSHFRYLQPLIHTNCFRTNCIMPVCPWYTILTRIMPFSSRVSFRAKPKAKQLRYTRIIAISCCLVL